MTTVHQSDRKIEIYLASLHDQLSPISQPEREEILREIGAHIRDSAEGSGISVNAVLARLGTPEELAAEYREGLLIQRASLSFSPLLLLRATLRLAGQGLVGSVVFMGGFIGYITGISLLLTGLLKPFMPGKVGLWMQRSTTVWRDNGGGLSFGVQASHPRYEVLGWWTIPVGILGGALVLSATTLAIRAFLRSLRSLDGLLDVMDTKK